MRQVDWKVFVMILYPRPKTGVTSRFRTLESEITYGLAPSAPGAFFRAASAIHKGIAVFFTYTMTIIALALVPGTFYDETKEALFYLCAARRTLYM